MRQSFERERRRCHSALSTAGKNRSNNVREVYVPQQKHTLICGSVTSFGCWGLATFIVEGHVWRTY